MAGRPTTVTTSRPSTYHLETLALDVLSNYLMHLEPAVLPIVLSHLTDMEATYTLTVIVGIRDEASRRRRRLARPAGRHAAASRNREKYHPVALHALQRHHWTNVEIPPKVTNLGI